MNKKKRVIELKHFQKPIYNKVVKSFKKNNKVLLNGLCGMGKTVISLYLIKNIIADNKRVAISTYSLKGMRSQWFNELIEFFPELMKDVQVICNYMDKEIYTKEYKGIDIFPFVTCDEASKDKLITFFIPQSINCDIGLFDYFIIDEAHEYLDVKTNKNNEGQLKFIINNGSKKTTKFLGLTGTGHELIEEGGFFEDCEIVMYDIIKGLKDKAINNCNFYIKQTEFGLNDDCYNGDELNSKGIEKVNNGIFEKKLNIKGKSLLRENAYISEKIKMLIKGVKGKTLIIIPRGEGREFDLCNAINAECFDNKIVAVPASSEVENSRLKKNFARFHNNNSNVQFLIVKDMCGVGYDYPDLANVIDLTFTKNSTLIIQRAARTFRISKNKENSNYYYVFDQGLNCDDVLNTIARALTLTIEYFFKSNKNIISKSIKDQMIKNLKKDLDLDEENSYINKDLNKENVDNDNQENISFEDLTKMMSTIKNPLFNLEEDFKACSKGKCFNRDYYTIGQKVKELYTIPYLLADKILGSLKSEYEKDENDLDIDNIMLMNDVKCCCEQIASSNKSIYEIILDVKKKYPDVYKITFGKKIEKTVMIELNKEYERFNESIAA